MCLKAVVGVSMGPPHVLKQWLSVSKGMLPAKNICPTKPLCVSVESNGDRRTAT